ncbi:hypothetical protein [Alistipes putredinis]|uniref:hypothetical protein n=1 Tax=Alistipes putredinis TaxID=28117 RepID=UPI004029BFB2
MTEVTELLGSTGVVPAGDYSPEKTYDFLNMVYAAPSVYVSRKNNNTGHPVTDTDWWMLSIDGSKNPEAVKAALDAAAKALEAAAAAAPVVVNVEGADVTINVEGNHKYICGELTSLNIASVENSTKLSIVRFTSGATKTQFSYPENFNITGWTKPEENKSYTICILFGAGNMTYDE